MSQKKSKVPEDFFSPNISKINIVAGRNASRKTTLLNLLGFKEEDLKKHFNYMMDSWFSIYRITDKSYVLEGNNIGLIDIIGKKIIIKVTIILKSIMTSMKKNLL